MYVLGIESSCDETAASVLRFEGEEAPPRVRSNIVATQEDIHGRFGGVVPELASRRHVELIQSVVGAALAGAGVSAAELDAIAVTRGPGLVVALLVGVSAAKALAWARDLPLVPVHHLNGHIYSLFLEESPDEAEGESGRSGGPPPFPHLAFVVSGGHTDFYRVEDHCRVTRLGGSVDDAAGEAFDKVAAALGLGYPGGREIDRLHEAFRAAAPRGKAVEFPRPKLKGRPYDMSFSGLKTAVLNYMKTNGYYLDHPDLPPWARSQKIPGEAMRSVAAGFQEAAVELLVQKVETVAEGERLGAVSVSGGVASNRLFRRRLAESARESGWSLHLPAQRYCTDNAAMIACAGGFRLRQRGRAAFLDFLGLDADPAWELHEENGDGGG